MDSHLLTENYKRMTGRDRVHWKWYEVIVLAVFWFFYLCLTIITLPIAPFFGDKLPSEDWQC